MFPPGTPAFPRPAPTRSPHAGRPARPSRRAVYGSPPFPIACRSCPASDERVMRCFVAPWKRPEGRTTPNFMHPKDDVMAFMDGHVKTVTSRPQYDSYCDGATLSPNKKNGGIGMGAATRWTGAQK